jgi:hypothetical protein
MTPNITKINNYTVIRIFIPILLDTYNGVVGYNVTDFRAYEVRIIVTNKAAAYTDQLETIWEIFYQHHATMSSRIRMRILNYYLISIACTLITGYYTYWN